MGLGNGFHQQRCARCSIGSLQILLHALSSLESSVDLIYIYIYILVLYLLTRQTQYARQLGSIVKSPSGPYATFGGRGGGAHIARPAFQLYGIQGTWRARGLVHPKRDGAVEGQCLAQVSRYVAEVLSILRGTIQTTLST